jgi:hypothetical protein
VEGHVLRFLGDIAAHPDRLEVDAATAHYRQALALAEELSLRPLMTHCHLGLGVLYRRTGKREQAREHLAPATTMYREMGMPYWLEKRWRFRSWRRELASRRICGDRAITMPVGFLTQWTLVEIIP